MSIPPFDLIVHATHEAGLKVGGIGAVLDNLLAQPAYNRAVERTVLVGPYNSQDPLEGERLHAAGNTLTVQYSSEDDIVDIDDDVAQAFERVELYYHVKILYGRRRFGEAIHEVLLVDPNEVVPSTVESYKYFLWNRYGIESQRYESDPEYEWYVRAAEPSLAALQALVGEGAQPRPPALRPPRAERAVMIAHEWLGLPLAFSARLRLPEAYRTVFYAHEVATVRPLIEHHPGHDTRFYSVMDRARDRGLFLEDVFGDQSSYFKHALIMAAANFDGFLAVGNRVLEELQFLAPAFAAREVALVYNGVPTPDITLSDRRSSKARLRQYAANLFDFDPTWVFSHVTRLILSKGLWRDIRVMEHLDNELARRGETAVLFTLSSALPAGRRAEQIYRWEEEYGWPVYHRQDNGDLVGLEVEYYHAIDQFNQVARASRIVLINQFGWNRERCGTRMPAEMRFPDIRWGTDVEFGQSIYEPFGIAQLEPLGAGALCCLSNVCGCLGFIDQAGGTRLPNVVVADYVSLPPTERRRTLPELLNIGRRERDLTEAVQSVIAAQKIIERLPRREKVAEQRLQEGAELSQRMSWRAVVEDQLLPALDEIASR